MHGQSCQFETFSDLTTILHTGDRLYFNAIIGPRDGSTKWRSLKTWIKMRPQQQQQQQQTNSNSNGLICNFENVSSHSDTEEKSDDSSSSSHGGYSKIINNQLNSSLITTKEQTTLYQANQGGSYIIGSALNTTNQSNFSVSSPISSTNQVS